MNEFQSTVEVFRHHEKVVAVLLIAGLLFILHKQAATLPSGAGGVVVPDK